MYSISWEAQIENTELKQPPCTIQGGGDQSASLPFKGLKIWVTHIVLSKIASREGGSTRGHVVGGEWGALWERVSELAEMEQRHTERD